MGFIPADAAVRSSPGVRWSMAAVALAVLAADQVSKSLVLAAQPAAGTGAGWFSVRLVRNTGASGGIASGYPVLVTLAAIGVTAIAAAFALHARSRAAALCLAAVLGGAAGNLSDRIFRAPGFGRGGVVDWIHFGPGGGSMDVADLAIQFGVLGTVVAIIASGRIRKAGQAAEARASADDRCRLSRPGNRSRARNPWLPPGGLQFTLRSVRNNVNHVCECGRPGRRGRRAMTAVTQRRDPPSAGVPGSRAGSPSRARASTVLTVIAAGAAAAIALWWHGTPSLHGFGDWLTNAGRITGLEAGYGVVVLVALMARIPPLERGVGADRLSRWHSMGGRYVIGLVVAHVLLITWGYAVTAHTTITHQAWTLLDSYPDVLLATAAGVLLVMIAVISARAVRPRMRYESWYYLHFYTYLAVALAFSHQFADGAEFMTNTAARVAWSAMYIGVGAAITWYRFVTPVRQAFRHRLRVATVTTEAPGVVSVAIAGRHLAELRAESGQFFRWRFLTRDLWWTSSPYSLSEPPRPDRLRITVKAAGDHSAALLALRPGTRVVAEGPYGALTGAARRHRKVLLIAGGVGITPLRALLESLPATPGDLTLIYRVSSLRDAVFRRELEEVAARRQAKVWFVAGSRAELDGNPLSGGELTRRVPGLIDHDVYLCGPPGLTAAVTRELLSTGVRRRQIHRESFEF